MPDMLDAVSLPYRRSVGIMLINEAGSIWTGLRRNFIVAEVESWQMPQGGIDENEDPAVAALRELAEETGTDKAQILAQSPRWLNYDLPAHLIGLALGGKYRGQTQKWFAMRFLGSDDDFNIHAPPGGYVPEFDAWRWCAAEEVLRGIVPFKRTVYEAVVEEFSPLLRRHRC